MPAIQLLYRLPMVWEFGVWEVYTWTEESWKAVVSGIYDTLL